MIERFHTWLFGSDDDSAKNRSEIKTKAYCLAFPGSLITFVFGIWFAVFTWYHGGPVGPLAVVAGVTTLVFTVLELIDIGTIDDKINDREPSLETIRKRAMSTVAKSIFGLPLWVLTCDLPSSIGRFFANRRALKARKQLISHHPLHSDLERLLLVLEANRPHLTRERVAQINTQIDDILYGIKPGADQTELDRIAQNIRDRYQAESELNQYLEH